MFSWWCFCTDLGCFFFFRRKKLLQSSLLVGHGTRRWSPTVITQSSRIFQSGLVWHGDFITSITTEFCIKLGDFIDLVMAKGRNAICGTSFWTRFTLFACPCLSSFLIKLLCWILAMPVIELFPFLSNSSFVIYCCWRFGEVWELNH